MESRVQRAQRRIDEALAYDASGSDDDTSLPTRDDFHYATEFALRMRKLREELQAAQEEAGQAAADAVVQRDFGHRQHSAPIETPAAPPKSNQQKFFELMADRLGRMFGEQERALKARADGYLLAKAGETDALRQRVDELESRLRKLERRVR